MANQLRYRRFRRCAVMLAIAALLANTAGCVERRMTIRSNPDGAMVYVDDYPIGTTPVSTSYTYYGTRKIRLVKDGYETLTVYQPMPTPWYQWCGIDFFSENVWPWEIRDERSFTYQMCPTVLVPSDQLLSRADQLRAANRSAAAAEAPPLSAPPPIGLPPPGTTTFPAPPIAAPVVAPNTLPTPMNVGPPVMSAPPSTFNPTPNNVAPGLPAPMPGSIPTYGPPGGTPGAGVPYIPPAGTTPAAPGTYPNYPLPGGTPSGTPGSNPGFAAPPSQPVLPPDWRPMGQTQNQNDRR